jgi:hypothetical protein
MSQRQYSQKPAIPIMKIENQFESHQGVICGLPRGARGLFVKSGPANRRAWGFPAAMGVRCGVPL